MKRKWYVFLTKLLTIVILLSGALNITANAISNKYDLDELELELTIPSEYSVITRNTPANDPIFSKLGITKSTLVSQFKASNIYLNAVSNNYNEEIVVTMAENILNDFGSQSDTMLSTLASTIINQYDSYGLNVLKYDIYQHVQTKFIRIYFTDVDNTVYGLQYYTVHTGKAMNFTMRSYQGKLSSRQENVIKNIVDSIKYDKTSPINEQGDDTNSFVYTDSESGVTFTVPNNWKQGEFTKDREYIDVKFVSTKDDGCTMIYGSTDMWGLMSDYEKSGYTRSQVNNSFFTKYDVAQMFNSSVDNVSTVVYDDVQYFKCENTYTADVYGVNMSTIITQLLYIDNGWMYMFQFSGASTHKLYGDFERLLQSVNYSGTSGFKDNVSKYEDDFENSNNNSDYGSGLVIFIGLLSVATVVLVMVVISRRKRVKEGQYSYNGVTAQTINKNIICKKCGQLLPSDSDFCHICGKKIEKES